MGTKQEKLAVVILNWNGEKMLRQFLPIVCRFSHHPSVSIYVADNASTDNSCTWVKTAHPEVKLITLQRNYGFAEGYNRALSTLKADYYLLLNSDVEVTEGWLPPLLTFMDTHPQVAACQPKLLSWWKKENFEYAGACGGYLDGLGYPYCRGRIFDVVEQDNGQYDTAVPIDWASGAALMVRSRCYWDCGGLDGTFFAHMEEIDLCWRLRLEGKEIYCIPQSSVYHVGGATLNKANPRKTYLNFRNNLFMLYKNLPYSKLFTVMSLRFVLDYVAALAFLLKGELANANAVKQARIDFWKMRTYRKNARREVQKRVTSSPINHSPISILWSYHIKRIRTFAKLP